MSTITSVTYNGYCLTEDMFSSYFKLLHLIVRDVYWKHGIDVIMNYHKFNISLDYVPPDYVHSHIYFGPNNNNKTYVEWNDVGDNGIFIQKMGNKTCLEAIIYFIKWLDVDFEIVLSIKNKLQKLTYM